MTAAIRSCAPGDEAALALVGAATFLESYSGVIDGDAIVRHCAERQTPDYYAAALADARQALWIAEMDPGAAPVGYLHLSPPDLPVPTGPDDVEIKRIYVLSKLQRSGLGRRLLEAAVDRARASGKRTLFLGVYKGNERALAFYGATGFEAVGEREFEVGGRIYSDWVMAKAV
jgi:ribosomal protein S18 acetylase RimI-like enzyme